MGTVALAALLAAAAPTMAKELPEGADPIAFMQGEWVSRFEKDTTRITVEGNTIRLTAPDASAASPTKFMNAGETVATVGEIKSDGPFAATEPPLRRVVFNGTCTGLTNPERNRYAHPCRVTLTGHPAFKLERKKNQIGIYYSLSIENGGGDFYRVDEKPKIAADYEAKLARE